MNLRGAKGALIATLAIVMIGCSWWSRRVKLGEQFTMRPKDKVVVAGTGLTIRLDEVGHQTFSGPGPSPSGASYVVLLVTSERGSRSIRISVGDTTEAGDYVIKVDSANPFRSDDGPRCELTVTSGKK
jgi:hypothetical protein